MIWLFIILALALNGNAEGIKLRSAQPQNDLCLLGAGAFRPLATALDEKQYLREQIRQAMIKGVVPNHLIDELNSVTRKDCDEMDKMKTRRELLRIMMQLDLNKGVLVGSEASKEYYKLDREIKAKERIDASA